MTDRPTPDPLDTAIERHVESQGTVFLWCKTCEEQWPCASIQAFAELRAARAALQRVTAALDGMASRGGYGYAVNLLRAALVGEGEHD